MMLRVSPVHCTLLHFSFVREAIADNTNSNLSFRAVSFGSFHPVNITLTNLMNDIECKTADVILLLIYCSSRSEIVLISYLPAGGKKSIRARPLYLAC